MLYFGWLVISLGVNTLTAGAEYIRFFTQLLPHSVPLQHDLKELTSLLSNLNNFYSLEVVGRVSETQLQVGENSN